MIYDNFTGKPLDRPSDALPGRLNEDCDECGHYLISRCGMCGAPICCPACCAEDARESRSPQ
jgi:hypothetical protein